ncbi:hypothetical protein Zmor_001565 [Zophobas morio]|uniref:Ricin B lectin domain-containing protein n=1 Tax=Zophobas morio TaxID=2755281 RepID=A0AA38MPE2_9CUCU|nr:hypothetical protein Zmor_001565 [Zophobas morio]
MKQFNRSVSIFFLLWTAIVAQECYLERPFYIKSIIGGLTLDGLNPDNVKVSDFGGYSYQRWIFEYGDKPGHFFIVNAYNGLVLDVQNSNRDPNIILNTKSNSLSQQWILNWNGTILNVYYGRNMDIYQGDFFPGNIVIVYPDNGLKQQQWTLHEVS